jgi:hypothetical protein
MSLGVGCNAPKRTSTCTHIDYTHARVQTHTHAYNSPTVCACRARMGVRLAAFQEVHHGEACAVLSPLLHIHVLAACRIHGCSSYGDGRAPSCGVMRARTCYVGCL